MRLLPWIFGVIAQSRIRMKRFGKREPALENWFEPCPGHRMITDHNDFPGGPMLPPVLDPKTKNIMQVSRFHRIAAYTGCPRCAFPPRRPASGSVLSLYVPSPHAAPYVRGESLGCTGAVPSPMTLPFAKSRSARHSRNSHHPFQMGGWFRGLLVRYRCSLSSCLPP